MPRKKFTRNTDHEIENMDTTRECSVRLERIRGNTTTLAATPKKTVKQGYTEKIVEIIKKIVGGNVMMDAFVGKLAKMYEEVPAVKRMKFQEAMFDEIERCMCHLVKINEGHKKAVIKNKSTENIFAFFIQAFPEMIKVEGETDDENMSIISYVCQRMITLMEVPNAVVRQKSVELIGQVLELINDDVEVLEHVIQEMIVVLTTRTKEKKDDIRKEAYRSLSRLQNFRDECDPVVKLYLDGMRYDESADVRSICVEHIGLNKVTLLDIVTRTNDVDRNVRLAAYKRLDRKVKISCLRPSQVEDIFRQALIDEENIRDYVTNHLLSAWLGHTKKLGHREEKGSIVDFMCRYLPMANVTQAGSLCEKVVTCWIKKWDTPAELMNEMFLHLDEELLPAIPEEKHLLEEGYHACLCYVWYMVIKHIHSVDPDKLYRCEEDNGYLPNIPEYINLMKLILKKLCEVARSLTALNLTSENLTVEEFDDNKIALEMEQENWELSLKCLIRCLQYFEEICDPYSRKIVKEFPITLIMDASDSSLNTLAEDLFEAMKLIRKSEKQSEASIVKEWIETVREQSARTKSQSRETNSTEEEYMEIEDTQAIEAQKVKENQLKMQIIDLKDQMEKAIEEENFSRANVLKNSIHQYEVLLKQTTQAKNKEKTVKAVDQAPVEGENNDDSEVDATYTAGALAKTLILLTELLKRQKKGLDAGLEHFLERVIDPVLLKLGTDFFGFVTEDRAIECLGLFGSLSQDIAKRFYPVISEIAMNQKKDDCGKPIYRTNLQQIAFITLCDFCLFHPVDLLAGTNVSAVGENTTTGEQSQADYSEASKSRNEVQNLSKNVANLLIESSIKLNSGTYPFTNLPTDERYGLQYNITLCMMRMLISGKYADALVAQIVTNILICPKDSKYKHGFDKIISKDLAKLMVTPRYSAPLEGLSGVFEKFLKKFLGKTVDISMKEAMKLFGRLSNPEALKKMFQLCNNKDANIPPLYYHIPLDMIRAATDAIDKFPEHHHVYSILSGIKNFNYSVPIALMFDKKFEDENKEAIMVSWLAVADRLKTVSPKVKERRSYHTLMETHKSLRQLLEQYNENNKVKKKRMVSPATEETNSETVESLSKSVSSLSTREDKEGTEMNSSDDELANVLKEAEEKKKKKKVTKPTKKRQRKQ